VEAFLDRYGLPAIFVLMLTKAAGVPIPVPGDVIMLATAARAAEGKLELWQAFVVLLSALVLGGTVQFTLARGAGRGLLYRLGRYLGLTPARLDAAAVAVRRGGTLGVTLAVLTPGLRTAIVAACGLAGLPLRTFLPALALGNGAFLSLHFALGYVGWPLVAGLFQAAPLPWLLALVLGLLAAGLAIWVLIRRRKRPGATTGELAAEAVAAWHDATCPACLVLGSARE
jgi:membrane-associated protein